MERREFVEKLGVGSAVALVTSGALVAAYGTSTWAGNVVIGDIEARIGTAAISTLNVNGVISDGTASNGVLNNKVWINGFNFSTQLSLNWINFRSF